MKLEIDIPSILYNDAKENRNYISLTKLEIAWKAIADGKPLEQEPFINKPCISSRVCEHDKQKVLNVIRAEIAELSHYYPMGHDYQIAITRCIAVIDKYKAEAEVEDGNAE